MPLYKPSELTLFLQKLGITPKKALSQNFLIDGNIIRKTVDLGDITSDDVILEIGPGPGSITEVLLETGAQIIAVEKDRLLAESLEGSHPNLHLFCDDIMTFPIEETLKKHLRKGKKAKVVANLPYHLTTPILARLIPCHDLFSNIVIMIQKEVAKRFTATPGNKEYGSITVFINFYTDVKYAFTVSPRSFYPVPNVDSAVVTLTPKKPPEVSSEEFFKMTRTAFEQRRKMLRNSLSTIYPSDTITEALIAINKNPKARAEELSVDDWVELFHFLSFRSS